MKFPGCHYCEDESDNYEDDWKELLEDRVGALTNRQKDIMLHFMNHKGR